MHLTGFIGPSNPTRSPSNDVERTINYYLETRDAGTPKSSPIALRRPGLEPWIQFPAGPVRALFEQNNRAFGIGGNKFCELLPNQTAIVRGTVALDANPATISGNGTGGNQLFVTSGGFGYIYDLTTDLLTLITDAEFTTPTLMGAFVDSYFLSLNNDGFQLSDLLDGTSWNGLDVAQTNQTADQKIAMFVNQRRVYLWGSQHTEIWSNTGSASFPFAPIAGTNMETGIGAPWSVAPLDNTIFWLQQNAQGQTYVARGDGLSFSIVSTQAISDYLGAFPRVSDAIGWSFQERGHAFYVLYLPSWESVRKPLGVASLVYDVSQNAWTEWSRWSPTLMQHTPFLGRCHCYAFGKHLVGSRLDGTIFWMQMDRYHDGVIA